MMIQKAKIFISYSRIDEAFARQLAGSLSAMGADVWIDVEDIPAGLKWSSAIQQGLDVCDALLVVLSPEAMASINVEDEWQYFLDQKRPVFPILFRPAKVHFQLSRIQYVDFAHQPYERAVLHLNGELRRRDIGVAPMQGAEAPQARRALSVLPEQAAPPARSRMLRIAGLSAAGLVVLLAVVVFGNPPVMPTITATAFVSQTAPATQLAMIVPSQNGASVSSETPSATPTETLTATVTLTPTTTPTPTITLTPSRTRRGTLVPLNILALTQTAYVDTLVAQVETSEVLATQTAIALEEDHRLQTQDAYTDTPTPNFTQIVSTRQAENRATRTLIAAATQTQNAIISPTPAPTLTPNAIVCAGAPATRLNVGMRVMVVFPAAGQRYQNVNVRAQPSLSSETSAVFSPGRAMYIIGQPECVDRFIWYPIQTQNEPIDEGWIAEGGFEGGVPEYYIEPLS